MWAKKLILPSAKLRACKKQQRRVQSRGDFSDTSSVKLPQTKGSLHRDLQCFLLPPCPYQQRGLRRRNIWSSPFATSAEWRGRGTSSTSQHPLGRPKCRQQTANHSICVCHARTKKLTGDIFRKYESVTYFFLTLSVIQVPPSPPHTTTSPKKVQYCTTLRCTSKHTFLHAFAPATLLRVLFVKAPFEYDVCSVTQASHREVADAAILGDALQRRITSGHL